MKNTRTPQFKKYGLFFLFSILFQFQSHAQNFLWVKDYLNHDWEQGFGIAVDPAGNAYSIGLFDGNMDFGDGITVTSNGAYDVCIVKHDGNGNTIWVKTLGGTDIEDIRSIAIDGAGNIVVTGFFRLTVDFDPGPGVANQTSNGNFDVYILKLNSAGDFIWVRTFGGNEWEESYGIDTDANNNIYVTGSYMTTVDFDPGAGTDMHTSNGNRDAFIMKLSEAGNFLWAKTMGGSVIDEFGYAIAVDNTGNVYSTGTYYGPADLDPGPGTYTLTGSGAYVQKLDTNGNFVWAKSDECCTGYGITLDYAGNVIISGVFFSPGPGWYTDFDPGAGFCNLYCNGMNDIFIQKLSSSGDFLWAKQLGGSDMEWAWTVGTDAAGNVFSTGTFNGAVDFDPGAGSNVLNGVLEDMYVLKLDANGNFSWVQQITGGCNESPYAIALNSSAEIFIAGWYSGVVDFDPGAGDATCYANAGSDIFVLKLSGVQVNPGVEENTLNGVHVFPNPFSESVSLSFETAFDQTDILLSDVQGKQILHDQHASSEQIRINLEQLPSGMYFLKIITEKGSNVYKLIKE